MADIKIKSDQELAKLFREKGEGLRSFRFGLSGGKIRNIKEGAALRKERARIATEMRGRRK